MKRRINLEDSLFFLIFLMALAIRLAYLGKSPLNSDEAQAALQALSLARGEGAIFPAQPFYATFTSLLFFIFSDDDFTARLIPALVGSALVWVPFSLRKLLGKRQAILLSIAAALSPGMVAISRVADSQVIAIVFFAATLSQFLIRKEKWCGIFAAFYLLSGKGLYTGLISLSIAVGLTMLEAWLERRKNQNPSSSTIYHIIEVKDWNWKQFLAWFAGAFLVTGSTLFILPFGLSSAASSLSDYLIGWRAPFSNTSLIQVFVALAGYETLALIFGSIQILRSFILRDELGKFYAKWLLITLLIVLIYPSREVKDISWALLPLWMLAARSLSVQREILPEERLPLFTHTILVFVLMVFICLNSLGLVNQTLPSAPANIRLVGIIGALTLIFLITVLVGWGWSLNSASGGIKYGFLALLIIWTLSSTFHAAGIGRNPWANAWRNGDTTGSKLLTQTISNYAQWRPAPGEVPQIWVIDDLPLSLNWLLRDFSQVQYASQIPNGINPGFIITNEVDKEVSLESSYTGQSLVIEQGAAWLLVYPQEWILWAFLRQAPVEKSWVILWVKSDYFPGSEQVNTGVP